jgi:hypothetical protein
MKNEVVLLNYNYNIEAKVKIEEMYSYPRFELVELYKKVTVDQV